MKQFLPYFLTFAAATTLPLTAQIDLYNASSNYVSSNTSLRDSLSVGTSVDYSIAFDSVSPLSPTSGYTGPDFWGAHSVNNPDGALSMVNNRFRLDADSVIRMDYKVTAAASEPIEFASLLYFDAGGTYSISTDDALTYAWGQATNQTGASPTFTGQWVIRDASGVYISNESFSITGNNSSATSTSLQSTTWAEFAPASDDYYDLSLSYTATPDLNEVTAAGIYLTFLGTGDGTAQRIWQTVDSFQMTATAIPEPGAVGVVIAALSSGVLIVRRRRAAQ